MKVKWRACAVCDKFFREKLLAAHMSAAHGAETSDQSQRPRSRESNPASVKAEKPKGHILRAEHIDQANTTSPVRSAVRCWESEKQAALSGQKKRARDQGRVNKAVECFVAAIAVKTSNATPLANVWGKNSAALETIKAAAKEREHQALMASIQQYSLQQELERRAYRAKEAAYRDTAMKKQAVQASPSKSVVPPVSSSENNKRPPKRKGRKASQGFIPPPTIDCSCGGNNENCCRCFGSGYYPATAVKEKKGTMEKPISTALGGFASDPRGDIYSIRENGRFSSLCSFDSFDDESGPM